MVPSSDPPPDDALLLRRYVREGSEASFRALAGRHLPLIWSTARRVVNGDASLAEEIAQSVLTDFALKAATFPPDMPPAGWLHRHTVFTATKLLRSESRRRVREQAAALSDDDSMSAPPNPWAELAPHLDPALNRLRESDRQALLLRYFEKRPLREISRLLGTTEEAVRKRLDRSLTKLRTLLTRRGVVPALAAFALLLRDESVAAPAAALTRRIASAAWSGLENGVLPAAASVPWWKTRRTLTTAAVAVALALCVIVFRVDGSPSPARSGRPAVLTTSQSATSPRSSAEELAPVTLTATLITLPEEDVAPLMLNYTPGSGDEALYQQLTPRAAALQTQFHADKTLATTGHPLVILSGAARPSRTAFEKAPPPPNPDSFRDPPPRSNPSVTLRASGTYKYPTEFDPPDENGRIAQGEFAFKITGTQLIANISPPASDGSRLFECNLIYMFAPPEEKVFASVPLQQESSSGESNTVHQPLFHTTQCSLGPFTVTPGKVALAGMTSLPADIYPEGDRTTHRRTLLFIQFQP